jgi:glycosyltransferase involved in cell wall biosynthesis
VADPLISILVPCRDAAPWLAQALRSALGQTWPRLEVIVIDDGSRDGSGTIADSFASSRCRVLHHAESWGASAARNRAFAMAQGDYIQYLDADDFLAPDKLEIQARALGFGEAESLSFGSVVHFFDLPAAGEKHIHLARLSPGCSAPVDFLLELWNGTHPDGMVQPGQWLVPRALIEKAGPWNQELSVDDDGEFFTRVILAAASLLAVPAALSYYRKFRAGRNLSARAGWSRAGRASALRAAELKSGHLLGRVDGSRAGRVVQRLLTEQIVAAWPAWPELVEEGMRFLGERGLTLARPLEGSRWFRRLYPWIGWKRARWLQWHWRGRDRGPDRPVTATGPWSSAAAEAAHCSPPRATGRLPA